MSRMAAQYIRDMVYYPMREVLEIQFAGDESVYQYFGVSEDVWYAFKNTASMDIYFNSQIASKYRYKRTKKEKKK